MRRVQLNLHQTNEVALAESNGEELPKDLNVEHVDLGSAPEEDVATA